MRRPSPLHVVRRAAVPAAAAALLAAVGLGAPPVRAGTITVCPTGCDHATLGAALGVAVDGDVIAVGAGTYAAGVVVTKAVTIRGAGREATILTGGKSAAVALQNATGRSTLQALTISGGIGVDIDRRRYGGGVYVKGKSATLDDVLITGNGTERAVVATYDGGGLYIDAGDVTALNVVVTGNKASNAGAGVVVNLDGTLTMTGGRIADNVAANPAAEGMDDTNARGGGLLVDEKATLTDVEISGNTASTTGGGVQVAGIGKLTLVRCRVVNNKAQRGGGIYNASTVTIDGGTVEGNEATDKGGGLLTYGTATVTTATFSGNKAGGPGGGIGSIKGFGGTQSGALTLSRSTIMGNTAGLNGGGIYVANDDPNDTIGAEVAVDRSTFSGNKAQEGGGAYLDFGRLEITDSTIAMNDAVFEGAGVATNQNNALRLGNSIIANDMNGENCYNKIASLGNNLDTDGTCAFQNRGDITSGNVQLGPLADNGGPTLTHAIQAGSSAIDAGNPGRCAQKPLDQRGAVRPVDGDGDGTKVCDIGSYEYLAEIPGTATPTSTRTPTGRATTPGGRTATPTPSPTFLPPDETPSATPTFVEGDTPTPMASTPTPGGAWRAFMPYAERK
ncbi:MAG: choice-of-anchor Q domain-containing protein [Anaerolineae bacterium]